MSLKYREMRLNRQFASLIAKIIEKILQLLNRRHRESFPHFFSLFTRKKIILLNLFLSLLFLLSLFYSYIQRHIQKISSKHKSHGKTFLLPLFSFFNVMWCWMFIQMMKRRDGFPVHFCSRPDQWRVALKSHRNTNTGLKSSSWCWTRSNKRNFFVPLFLNVNALTRHFLWMYIFFGSVKFT